MLTETELRNAFMATNTREPLEEGWPGLEQFARHVEILVEKKLEYEHTNYQNAILESDPYGLHPSTPGTKLDVNEGPEVYCLKDSFVIATATATAHWDYVGSVLLAHGIDKNSSVYIASRFHYITAFEHGWKHGVENMKENGYLFSEAKRNK